MALRYEPALLRSREPSGFFRISKPFVVLFFDYFRFKIDNAAVMALTLGSIWEKEMHDARLGGAISGAPAQACG